VLLVKNTKRNWEIPGGKSEEKDFVYRKDGSHLIDIFSVAERELLEEVGCTVDQLYADLSRVYYDPERETLFLFYTSCSRAILWENDEPPEFKPTSDKSIEKSQWFHKSSIDTIELSFGPDRDFIKSFIFQ
jgi:8-oxo-dGTP pyrophosphatase MutT (NUDIX family)